MRPNNKNNQGGSLALVGYLHTIPRLGAELPQPGLPPSRFLVAETLEKVEG